MSRPTVIPKRQSLYRYLALILLLTTLVPAATPDHAAASSRPTREVLAGWPPGSDGPAALAPNQIVRVWLPPARPVGAPDVRPLLDAIKTVQIEGPIGTPITTKSLTADQDFTFYAVGYNGVTSTQEVTWTLSADVGALSVVRGPSTVLDATTVGSADLKAQLVTTPSISTTARINVTPGLPHHIVIRTGANESGEVAGTHAMTTDETWTLYAAGYDADNNYIDDLSVSWSVKGENIGVVAPVTGDSTVLDATKTGVGRVHASHALAGDDETGDITVSVGALHHVVVQSASSGGGSEVGDHTMTIYQTYTMWAAGYDADNNFREDVPATWDLVDGLGGALQPPSGTSTTFTPAPAQEDSGRIRATYSGLEDRTGLFTIQAPALSITKSDSPDPVPAGGYLLYTIRPGNTGNTTARNVRITETYDANVTFVSAGPPPLAGTNNVWVFDTLAVGAGTPIYVTVQVDGALDPSAILNNAVTIGGSRLNQVTDTESTGVSTAPDLVLTVTEQPDPVNAGANLVYRIHYVNQGIGGARNAYIVMAYDDRLTFVSSSPLPEPGTNNRWNLGLIGGGVSGDVDVTVRVDGYMLDQGALVSSATIRSDDTGTYTDFEETTVNAPALVLTKVDVPDPVVALDSLVYTLVYTNVGHAAAPGLNITDVVPANTSYASCRGLPCSYSSSNRVVTWDDGNGLPAGGSRSLALVVQVHRNLDTGTLLTNRARVRKVDEPRYSAVAQIDTTVVSSPSLSLSISNGQSAVEAGDELVYAVNYRNDGTGRAYGTTIVVTPPSAQHVAGVGCDPPSACELQGGQLVFDIGTLPSGNAGSGTVRMVATVRDPLSAGAIGNITATAEIHTDTPGDLPGDNSAQDVDPIATRPDLQLQVDYHNHTPYPGKRITYTVQYGNKGHIAITGVVVTASLPNYVTYQQSSSSAWKATGDREYVYTVGPLDYNQGGALLLVTTLPTGTFTTDMCSFDAAFEIVDSGISGADANPGSNVAPAPLGVADLVVEDVEVNWGSLVSGEVGPHVTATLRNLGSVWACNSIPGPEDPPDFCAGFYLDLYLNPPQVPPSYPGAPQGYVFVWSSGIPPNSTQDVPFSFAFDFGDPSPLYVRVDNQGETGRPFGYVPECNEFNNVFGPVRPSSFLYLPVVLKNH
jgi:uncharacterized repeat protein (TIGR01451 family)